MSSPDVNDKDKDNALREKLEELEALLDSGRIDSGVRKITVPVLDELVTEADFRDADDARYEVDDVEQIEEEIVQLAEKLEHRLGDELDQLVGLLKGSLKNSIVEELRRQASLDEDNTPLDDAGEKSASTPLHGGRSEDS